MPHHPIGIRYIVKKRPAKIQMETVIKIKDNDTAQNIIHTLFRVPENGLKTGACIVQDFLKPCRRVK